MATQPQNQTQTVGSTATFSVSVNGSAPFLYFWYKNGAQISGANSSSYTTPSLTSSDNGNTYYCIITNCSNLSQVTSSTATLSINTPCTAVSMATQPQNQTQTVGSTATFSVSVNGSAPFLYFWYKNGAQISGANSSSYTTPSLTTADNGNTYYCIITNCSSTNQVISSTATLSINTPCTAVSIVTQPQDRIANVGSTATFSISVNGTAPFLYFWYKNDVQIPGASNSSYTTATLTISDNGNVYKCIIINCNNLSQAISNIATLTVNSDCIPVTAVSYPTNQTVSAPASTTFSVVVTGTTPTYQWQYSTNAGGTWNNVPNSSPYSGVTTNNLSINPTSASMSGYQYRCMIGGTCSTTWYTNWVTLTVNSDCIPVSIVMHPLNQTITPGTAVTFNVSASGTTPILYSWFKNGVQIPSANSSSYTTPALTVNDDGDYYYCTLTNCNNSKSVSSNYAYLTLKTIQNTISIISDPSNGGTTTGSGIYTYNQLITIKAIPNSGYNFINWTKNGTQISSNSSFSFNIIDNINLIANFNLINKPKIYVEPNNLTIYEQTTKSENILESYHYKVTEEDLLLNKNYSGAATRVIIPQSVTENWKKSMLQKHEIKGTMPNLIDWSNFDTPVKDQNPCGSCWAFAAIALLENLANQGQLLSNVDFSEQQMVSCVPNTNCINGGHPWWAFEYVKNNGLLIEDCFKYVATESMCSKKCLNPSTVVNISQFTGPLWYYATIDNLKLALQDGPLAVEMFVPNNFSSYKGGIIDYKNEGCSWGHSVLLVGYDDNLQCFKVKNSYGSAIWGEKGYFRIAYNSVTNDLKFGISASSAKGIYVESQNGGEKESFTIKNLGDANLTISSITSDKKWLSITPQNVVLHPSESSTITVTLSDWSLISGAAETAILTINSNDPIEPEKQFDVTALKSVNSAQPQLLVSTDFYQDNELPATNCSAKIYVGIIGKGIINWNAETKESWINLSNSNGINDGVITVNCLVNNTGISRNGFVTISSSGVSNSPQVVSITQGTNNAPVISNITKAVKNLMDTISFSSSEFSNHFIDPDGNTLKLIRIESFPTNGTLIINDHPVVSKQTIIENEIRNLIFIPNIGWDGILNFEYNASDGSNYALKNANVNSILTYIHENESSKSLKIYPNPAKDILNIEFDTEGLNKIILFTLYNSTGQAVLTNTIENSFPGKVRKVIDVKYLSVGIYYFQIKLDGGYTINRKIVIQK
jgi:C1A family cysteine protease